MEYGIIIPEGYTGIRQMIITADNRKDNLRIMMLIRHCIDNVGGIVPAHLVVDSAYGPITNTSGHQRDPRGILARGFALHIVGNVRTLAYLRAFTYDRHYMENFRLKLSLYGLPDEWFERLRYYSDRKKLRRDLTDGTNRIRRRVTFW